MVQGIIDNKKKKGFLIMAELENGFDWVTPSEMAKIEGVTTSMVYVRMKEGRYMIREFKRGTMKGWLLKLPDNK